MYIYIYIYVYIYTYIYIYIYMVDSFIDDQMVLIMGSRILLRLTYSGK